MKLPATRNLRRLSQVVCLATFLWLFLQTEYRGFDQLSWPVSLLFRIDPLAALADALAPGPFHWALLWPALVVVALTALLGRVFCGWVCPMGTLLDGTGSLARGPRRTLAPGWRRVKYYLLFTLMLAGLFGVQQLGLFDPLSIFLRTLTLSLYPVWNWLLNGLYDFVYHVDIPLLSDALNASYPWARDHVMAFVPPSFELALFTLAVFVAILLLERFERRFWCRNLCPLGALLGLCSAAAPLRREPSGDCGGCRTCAEACRGGAADGTNLRASECLICLDCSDYCPTSRARFVWQGRPALSPVDLPRRGLLTALAAGAVTAPVIRTLPAAAKQNDYLIRPPGAVAEEEFLRRCIRCGECMKVCIGQALHPALLQAGAAALWTPLLVARLGYCEYNCTLCGQVCPTGAIENLKLEKKKQTVIGLAVFNKDRCLPFARGEECLVCEEHCPTPEKAIVFDQKEVLTPQGMKNLKLPRVVQQRCIGCGICETRCPVAGVSAIRVIHEGETRAGGDALQALPAYGNAPRSLPCKKV